MDFRTFFSTNILNKFFELKIPSDRYITDDDLPRRESQSSTASIVLEKEMNETFFHSWLNNFDSHCIYTDFLANILHYLNSFVCHAMIIS